MLASFVKNLDRSSDPTTFHEINKLSLRDLEQISIADISSLRNNKLKDLLNVALRQRLEHHQGGCYTGPGIDAIVEDLKATKVAA